MNRLNQVALVAAGMALGGGLMFTARARGESASCSIAAHSSAVSNGLKCPVRVSPNALVAEDAAAGDHLRRALRDGVFTPWVELGRAPTPDEMGERLRLDEKGVTHLIDALEVCGQTMTFGVLRAPQSQLIAVAWPFSNVPTDITVRVEGGKPVFARCAIDALGISKMVGRKTEITGQTRDDGRPVRIVVDRETLVEADPPNAVVWSADCCDDIAFFSSREGLEKWTREKHGRDGQVRTLADALRLGSAEFGRYTAGL